MRGGTVNEDFDKVAERASYWMDRAERADAAIAALKERLKRYEDGLGAKDHFLIRAEQAEAEVAALKEEERKTAIRFDTVFEQRNKAEAEVLSERKRGDEYLAKWGDALKTVARLEWMLDEAVKRYTWTYDECMAVVPATADAIASEKADLADRYEAEHK